MSRPDRCDVYLGTQVQQLTQAVAAEAAGLQPEQVNVHTTLLGGGFGRRLEVDFVPAAVVASKALGAPVKLIWTREDDMTHDLFRPPAREAVSAGLDEQGRLVAWSLQITSPSITARFDPTNKDPFDSVIEYVQNFPYAVPQLRPALQAAGDRNRCRIFALGEPRAELLCHRKLDRRARGRDFPRPTRLSPDTAAR